MDNKKDIYNLWIQYTTKNEEAYFREFIVRFVSIWKSQLDLQFDKSPAWNHVKTDHGPHLSRLPDELLPAIGKFVIIARDEAEKDELTNEKIKEIAILIECMVIICRHFDNISTVMKFQYKTNLIDILTRTFHKIVESKKHSVEILALFQNFSHLLEVVYDPYLTWRSYLNGNFANFLQLHYKPQTIHVEIVPFIYDCFQQNVIFYFPEIAINLLNALGALISGSQKSLTSMQSISSSGERKDSLCGTYLRNGLRAVCPATVSVITKLISTWECDSSMRHTALKCCTLMIIVLQRSSPEERQIDLSTLIQMYCEAILDLINTDNFKHRTFEIDSGEQIPIDVNALALTIENITVFLSDTKSRNDICVAISETNLIDILLKIPGEVKYTFKDWNIDSHDISYNTIKALSTITKVSRKVAENLKSSEKFDRMFAAIKEMGRPSNKLLTICFDLALDKENRCLVIPKVIEKLIQWLPDMNHKEQTYISELILKGCASTYVCKSLACDQRTIKVVSEVLTDYNQLSHQCIQHLIKLIEELSKLSIVPIELKRVMALLKEQTDFPHSKHLLQTLVTISLQNLNNGNICSQYFDIENHDDGIFVPDIRNWIVSGSYGFIFHILLKLNPLSETELRENMNKSQRRMLLTLKTANDVGFEVFIQHNGNVVVAAITRRDYLTSSVHAKTLFDNRWHYITVAVTPPKRPFSYSQINVYIDFMQKLSATLKVQAVNDPFTVCTIGSAYYPFKATEEIPSDKLSRSASSETAVYRGMIPSILERTLSTHVSNYFTLPLRNTTSFDPNVKNFPVGMQDNVFGEAVCLGGQIGSVLLAEPATNIKIIFDAGPNFASIFSQDNDLLDLASRFVFCYSAASYHSGICQDLIPGGKYFGTVIGQHSRIVKIQTTINSIGGIQAILPILHNITRKTYDFSLVTESAERANEEAKTPINIEEFSDWEVLSSSSYTEWKMIQQPVASFVCFLRYLTHDHENNQENLLNSDCISIIGLMLQKCHPQLFDVNALMATHLFIESMQNQKPSANANLLATLYTEIVFNFSVWSKFEFQITLGHIQYLSTMIKNDRKFYRKQFGIQFFLDVIRQFYSVPENITLDDAKTIRSTIFSIVRYYLQKDVNVKEINIIISFLASVKYEHILIEFLEMLTFHLKGKNCKDQIMLLLHEPQTANLLYNFFIDKIYSSEIHAAAIRFIDCLLLTSRVQQKYKQILRLQDPNMDVSLYPGLFSYMIPLHLSQTVICHLIDQLLSSESDLCGVVYLVHHMNVHDIVSKLEVAKKLLQTTFVKQNSPMQIANQAGWQESISRLLIRKPMAYPKSDGEKHPAFGINLNDILLEDNSDFISQSDLINFCEQSVELNVAGGHDDITESALILNEIQASVTEAANVIESEIKELAGSVSGAVAENVASVFSVIRQRTSEIQDTFESLALGNSLDSIDTPAISPRPRADSNSSSSSTQSPSSISKSKENLNPGTSFDFSSDVDVDQEEQLVYLVTNILFTIFWRGVGNDNPNCWKERGQVLACINLLGLNNELISSHLTLRLRILEMGVQASLFDLSEHGSQTLINQENASQILRMVYDLVVLGTHEDESKKCSTKLLDGVLALLDALMVFQNSTSDDWSDMIRLCLGLLLKCSHHSNPGVVAMATAKLHAILQSRNSQDPAELAYLLYSINKALDSAIAAGNPEEYSFLMPVMKALLDKCREVFNLDINLPDSPSTSSGPVFFNDFQMYSTSKKWKNFIDKMIKPLYCQYQKDVETTLWEPINRFWAECYESCKKSSLKRSSLQTENRRIFQQKIVMPWKVRQMEEIGRLNSSASNLKTKSNLVQKKWKTAKRFLYGPRGPWYTGELKEEFWSLSIHENVARMRLKLEPLLYPNKHENAANLRDNTVVVNDSKQMAADFDSTIKSAVVRDFLTDDENILLDEELRQSIESQTHQDVPLEKVVIGQDCELITLMTKLKGRIEVNQSVFTFIDLSPPRDDGEKSNFRFPINKIREVHLRKYNLRRSALEIFLIDQTSYFLNFKTKTRNKIFTKILSLQPPNILYGSGQSPSELLKSSGLTQKWVNREISNFEYLMYLNTIAGRSYNDLSQYPVFPWILADYTSEVLDLTDPKSFRDLSKPVGVINPKNEAEVRSKYESFEDPSGAIPKFHYGTHYSNSAGVLHYLLRVEPFTSLHIDLQSGRFDVADRQFHSIPQTWKLLMDNPNDVKELIPEFFYFPEFLRNMNKFDLGLLQLTKEKVDNVILPPWANTPEEFIAIHRRALESEIVSQNLHNWIDLIFGYKQKGPKAAEALNVFYYCSYEGAVDLDKITNPIEREAVEGMINNFGQIPSQLLRDAHPQRLTHEETISKIMRSEMKRLDITHFLDRVIQVHCEFSTPKDPIIFLSVPRSPPRSFLQLSPDVLVSISKSSILGLNSWISYDKEKGFLLEVDATTTNLKNRRKVFGPFHPALNLNSQMFAVSIDGKYLYAGGIWDNSLRVLNLHKGKTIASVTRHLDIITCVALDNCGSYLVTGSKDCTCIVWSLPGNHIGFNSAANSHLYNSSQLNSNNIHTPIPMTTLYGHDDAISCVSIYTELDMVVSGSMDGTVNVYSIQDGQFIRTLKPLGCTEFFVQISFVTLSYQGHVAFSALDDVSHSVHVYNINGASLGSKYVSGRVTGLTTASDYLVVADDAGDITMSRLNGLKPVFDIPLHVPIQTVVVTQGNTHILAPLRDGRLAVIVVATPSNKTRHSVLNV